MGLVEAAGGGWGGVGSGSSAGGDGGVGSYIRAKLVNMTRASQYRHPLPLQEKGCHAILINFTPTLVGSQPPPSELHPTTVPLEQIEYGVNGDLMIV